MVNESDRNYDDFSIVSDGFTDVSSESKQTLQYNGADADPGEVIKSNANASLDKIDVLLSQHGAVIDAALALSVTSPENLADVGHAIKTLTAPIVMQFTDIKVLREFIRRHGMFGVRIASLINVPDVVKDRLYEQSVWDVRPVDYPILLDRVQSVADATAAQKRKEEVGKRMLLRDKRRVTAEFSSPDETINANSRSADDGNEDDNFEG